MVGTCIKKILRPKLEFLAGYNTHFTFLQPVAVTGVLGLVNSQVNCDGLEIVLFTVKGAWLKFSGPYRWKSFDLRDKSLKKG